MESWAPSDCTDMSKPWVDQRIRTPLIPAVEEVFNIDVIRLNLRNLHCI